MTTSASTPRLRLTLAYFLALGIIAGWCGPAPRPALVQAILSGLGLLLVALACLGRIWCSVFIAGRKDAEIVTTGPYALCRHPLYSLSFVGGVGLGVATQSFVLTIVTAVVLAWLLRQAARAEEVQLHAAHGEVYAQYVRATPRWWPRWRNWQIPEQANVRPRVVWKSFVDAGAFFLLLAAVEAMVRLREAEVLPTLLRLP